MEVPLLEKKNEQPKPLKGLVTSLFDQWVNDGDIFAHSHRRLIMASATAVTVFLLSAFYVLYLSDLPCEYLNVVERIAAGATALLQLCSNLTRLTPVLYREYRISKGQNTASGITVATMTIQIVAMITNLLLATVPTPVVIDPVVGCRVYLLRWAEWVPLCGLAVFLAEELEESGQAVAIWNAVGQALAVASGPVFAFTTGCVYASVGVVAGVIFSYLYVRALQKKRRLADMPLGDEYHRVSISLCSFQEFVFVWTYIVLQHYVLALVVPRLYSQLAWAHNPGIIMVGQCVGEVISKHLYILTVENVTRTFSESERNERRVEAFRRTMASVWENSSDTIVMSLGDGGNGRIYIFSPTVWSLLQTDSCTDSIAMVLHESEDGTYQSACYTLEGKKMNKKCRCSQVHPSVDQLHRILRDAWGRESGTRLQHEIDLSQNTENIETDSEDDYAPGLNESSSCCAAKGKQTELSLSSSISSEKTAFVEAIVSKRSSDAATMIVTLRDISERVRRFKVEKLAVEMSEREKHSQTTRFAKHEIKNGLLSAIGQCEAIKEKSKSSEDNDCPLIDLETTLHEVLDTVTSEAMSRDVVQGV